eukprot:GHVT01077062.1.p1 GENE.GHVT01077062.1~~GHVT01077062.1.p1  ORF type:complete len:158 (+),score=36.65 GHVT01077062.1:340-813(+)
MGRAWGRSRPVRQSRSIAYEKALKKRLALLKDCKRILQLLVRSPAAQPARTHTPRNGAAHANSHTLPRNLLAKAEIEQDELTKKGNKRANERGKGSGKERRAGNENDARDYRERKQGIWEEEEEEEEEEEVGDEGEACKILRSTSRILLFLEAPKWE